MELMGIFGIALARGSIFGQPSCIEPRCIAFGIYSGQSGTGYHHVAIFVFYIARHLGCIFVHGEVIVEPHVGTKHYLVDEVPHGDTLFIAGPVGFICGIG